MGELIICFRRTFPSGWVTLHVDAEAALGDLRPELYIDTGGGFAAHPAILIDIDAARGWAPCFGCRAASGACASTRSPALALSPCAG